SISIVTFVAGTSVLQSSGIVYEGYMVAVAAAMEAPAILSALWLISRGGPGDGAQKMDSDLWREILLNGSIVLLIGSFVIGWATGEEGLSEIDSFIVAPFKGVLCLFLLDMGLVAGRGLRGGGAVLRPGVLAFGVLMPLVGSVFGLAAGLLLGVSTGGIALFMVLSASASYIAVPAAMRVALPEANPSVYLTLSLGVTFPFNLTLGLPLYVAVANAVSGG
ncbi:MAG: sodium-dependent bicarbonate transport family permease, partial [Paracoccaceae bacterium]|nr:sodium-dependent bicarbonate transport family permease [Paracoccaceae bacterium]